MDTYVVDFETYYDGDYSVTEMGYARYVNDARFDAYLVSIVGETYASVSSPKNADWGRLHGNRVVAHNASFDMAVFLRLRQLGIVPQSCVPSEWQCSSSMAVFFRLPRNLKDAAAAGLGIVVDKTVRTKMSGKTLEDARRCGWFEEVQTYALNDSKYTYALWKKYEAGWPAFERELSRLTIECGMRGFCVDEEKLDAAMEALEVARFQAEADLPWVRDGRPPLSPKALAEQCRIVGITPPESLAKESERCTEWMAQYATQYPWVLAMRDWRGINTLLKKLKTFRDRRRESSGGRIDYSMKYFGAHTGRWSGDQRLNVQALHKTPVFGVNLRECVVPEKGYTFFVADLAQIEPRCMAWLCGDTEFMQSLREGSHPYEAHARQTMGWTGGVLKKERPDLYALAKARVLGLGYGCGAVNFVAVAKIMAGITLTEAESIKTVRDYRTKNWRVMKLWKKLESGLRLAAARKDPFVVNLPSGRTLEYLEPYSIKTQLFAKVGHLQPFKKFYGGILCENLVQAVARDVFADMLVRLASAGYRILFHVHDEVILEVPIGSSIEPVKAIMSQAPSCMADLVVDVEISESENYSLAK